MTESNNARFRELAPSIISELIATRVEFTYVPKGLSSPEQLYATWWAQEFIPVGEGYQRIGENGDRMTTVLADHADAVLEVTDPVTGEVVSLSALGAVKWLIKFFDYQYNLENPVPQEEEGTPEPETDLTEPTVYNSSTDSE